MKLLLARELLIFLPFVVSWTEIEVDNEGKIRDPPGDKKRVAQSPLPLYPICPSGNVPKYFVSAIWKMVERAKFPWNLFTILPLSSFYYYGPSTRLFHRKHRRSWRSSKVWVKIVIKNYLVERYFSKICQKGCFPPGSCWKVSASNWFLYRLTEWSTRRSAIAKRN